MRMAPLSLVAAALLVSAAPPPTHPARTPRGSGLVAHRFLIDLTGEAVSRARAAGVDLEALVDRALTRINALLPGAATTVDVSYLLPDHLLVPPSIGSLLPNTGTGGTTNPRDGIVSVAFGPSAHVPPATALRFWLPRTLAHQVNLSVRILDGPGCGQTLLDAMVCEGIASTFDPAAVPGPPDPWVTSLSAGGRCTWWRRAQPDLSDPGLFQQWFCGYFGVPHWTAFDLGYYLVRAYRLRHPHQSWHTLTTLPAPTIVRGGHYQPCA